MASESIKLLQRNWIGRSEGAEVDFYIGDSDSFNAWKSARAQSGFPKESSGDVLRIYTTRPDTLFGVTYMVLSPEHPNVDRLTTADRRHKAQDYHRTPARQHRTIAYDDIRLRYSWLPC